MTLLDLSKVSFQQASVRRTKIAPFPRVSVSKETSLKTKHKIFNYFYKNLTEARMEWVYFF